MLSLLLTANAERLVLKSDYRLRDAAAAAAFAAAAAAALAAAALAAAT